MHAMYTCLLVFLPMVAAVPVYFLAGKKLKAAHGLSVAVMMICSTVAAGFFVQSISGGMTSARLDQVVGLGLSFRADGFRSLYALVINFMWLMSSLMTPEYMASGHKQDRYLLFTLLTLGATAGVFLSDDLITAFVFFEMLSFTSYAWVAHEETPGAMRAAATYLAIAIFGGMAMLMGIMMLLPLTGTLQFDRLPPVLSALPDKSKLFVPSLLLLTGFGAKAGMFPLHVWLPKAHPVAPAPASALLSGALTKVGIFGILVVTLRIMMYSAAWHNLVLVLGLITMFVGALLAMLSIDLKRTLACSSMSQIGFILVGISMMGLLGEHNALAAQGTVLHMLNHSLIKLVLFMAAGVVYMNLHQLNLNDIRGFGRGKPLLHLTFLIGASSIGGIPLFSGYISKTLLHESIIEYVNHLRHVGESTLWYGVAELLFVITGGMTLAYMLKLYVTIFWIKPPAVHEDQTKHKTMGMLTVVALVLSSAVLLVLGLLPNLLMAPVANLALPFLNAHQPDHAVAYFSIANLLGAGKSILVGVLLYIFVIRRFLMTKQADGNMHHVDIKPDWLDLEDLVYRPGLRLIVRVGTAVSSGLDVLPNRLYTMITTSGHAVAWFIDQVVDWGLAALLAVGTFLSRLADSLLESVVVLLGVTLFKPPRVREPVPVGNRFTYTLGKGANALTRFLNGTIRKTKPMAERFTYVFASMWEEIGDIFRKITTSLSFSLMMFAVGLLIVLTFLMTR